MDETPPAARRCADCDESMATEAWGCPRCGAPRMVVRVADGVTLAVTERCRLELKDRDGARPVHEERFGWEWLTSTGEWRHVDRVLEPRNERYREAIRREDGTVVREVEELLTALRAHGSAKRKRSPLDPASAASAPVQARSPRRGRAEESGVATGTERRGHTADEDRAGTGASAGSGSQIAARRVRSLALGAGCFGETDRADLTGSDRAGRGGFGKERAERVTGRDRADAATAPTREPARSSRLGQRQTNGRTGSRAEGRGASWPRRSGVAARG